MEVEAAELRKLIWAKACDLLTRREHSTLELYNKLSGYFQKKFPDLAWDKDLAGLINDVLGDLKANNFLSNERFAELFIESALKRHKGPRLMQKQLLSKGITNDLWLEIWAKYEDQADQVCRLALEKWQSRNKDIDLAQPRFKAKAVRYLHSRGFFEPAIYDAIAINQD